VETIASGALELSLEGETLLLLPSRSMFWPRMGTLFVADLHLGKGSAFRAGAVPVPSGSTMRTLDRLEEVVSEVDARQLIVLGDLWHSKSARTAQTELAFAEWRNRRSSLDVSLVLGNHDLKSGDLPQKARVQALSPGFRLGPFQLLHEPVCECGPYGLAGHIHPGATLVGKGDYRLTAPCFWIRRSCAILPAFGEFTGLARIRPTTADRVFGIFGTEVREV
jgi:uncharacterized protein